LCKGVRSVAKLKSTGVGAHAVQRSGKKSSAASVSKRRKSKLRLHITLANVIRTVLILAVFVLMITPLQSCMLNDDDYIGTSAAKKAAIADVGLNNTKISDVQTELIKLDGEACYKVHFKTDSKDYRFIVDADSGEIIARAFKEIKTEEPY